MPKTLTPRQGISALKRLEADRKRIVLRVWRVWLPWARERSVTHYMHPQAGPEVRPRPKRLTHRSGRLGRSTKVVGPRYKGEALFGGLTATAPYAAIHEYGGRTRPHIIRPRRASVLRWMGPRGPRFATLVHHPGSNIPPRPRLAPAVADALRKATPDMQRQFRKAQVAVGLG